MCRKIEDQFAIEEEVDGEDHMRMKTGGYKCVIRREKEFSRPYNLGNAERYARDLIALDPSHENMIFETVSRL